MRKANFILVAAGISLALALTISCSSDDGGGGTLSYGGKTYKTVVIGTQTWMAENLNINVDGSKCYGEDGYVRDDNDESITLSENEIQANCNKYGRLYNWVTAIAICPSGWHLPTHEEWQTLIDYAGGSSTAGRHLKAKSGWNENGNGEDTYGFAALPGGYGSGNSGGRFGNVGYRGIWYSASEVNESNAYGHVIRYNSSGAGYENEGIEKSYFYSVRCVKD